MDRSKTMRRIKLKNIAEDAEISPQLFSNILKNVRRPSWEKAKRLEQATGISAFSWMEGMVDREYLLKNYNPIMMRLDMEPETKKGNARLERAA